MKTEIELNEKQAQALEQYCNLVHVSRDQAINQALSVFLPATTRSPKGALRTHPAFGSWRARRIDAVQYQQTLREEWPET